MNYCVICEQNGQNVRKASNPFSCWRPTSKRGKSSLCFSMTDGALLPVCSHSHCVHHNETVSHTGSFYSRYYNSSQVLTVFIRISSLTLIPGIKIASQQPNVSAVPLQLCFVLFLLQYPLTVQNAKLFL